MTIVAAIVDEKRGCVHVGADSVASADGFNELRNNAKVFRVEELVIGVCGSFRFMQIMNYRLRSMLTVRPTTPDLYLEWLATDFVEVVKTLSKTHMHDDDERESTMLVAVGTSIFVIEPDLQVGQPSAIYTATGSGRSYALGAFYASESKPAKTRLALALEAADLYTPTVSGPFLTVSTDPV